MDASRIARSFKKFLEGKKSGRTVVTLLAEPAHDDNDNDSTRKDVIGFATKPVRRKK